VRPEPAVSPPAGPVIRIATHSPLTGDRALLGAGIRDGARLAVEQRSDPLRDLGFRVEVVTFDDRASADVARVNAERIVADPDILLVIGHLTSNAALAAMEIYQGADLALISPANSDPALTGQGYRNVTRLVGRDDGEGTAAAEFAATDLRAKTAYVLHDGSATGQVVAAAFRRQAQERGVRILGEAALTASSAATVDALAAARPAVVFLSMTFAQAGPLLREAAGRKLTAVFLGPDWLDSPALARSAGAGVVGLHYVTIAGPAAFYGVGIFEDDYLRRFGAAPPPFALQGFDAASLGLEALAAAVRAAGGPPSRAQVTAALRGIRTFRGLGGTLSFDEHGDPKEAAYFVIRVASANPAAWEQRVVARTLWLPPPVR